MIDSNKLVKIVIIYLNHLINISTSQNVISNDNKKHLGYLL